MSDKNRIRMKKILGAMLREPDRATAFLRSIEQLGLETEIHELLWSVSDLDDVRVLRTIAALADVQTPDLMSVAESLRRTEPHPSWPTYLVHLSELQSQTPAPVDDDKSKESA